MKRTASVCCLLASLMIGGSALAQDWPQWRGAGRDAKVGDFKAPAAWPKELTAKWKVNVGNGGDSSPALVGDKLFLITRQGDEESIVCLDAAGGTEVWRDKYTTPAISGADAKAHGGPRSSPAVAEGKVVTLGVNGVITCLNMDGKLAWRKDSAKDGYGVPKFHTACSPLIADGLAIVQLGGGAAGAVVAYDLATGDQKWAAKGDGAGYASPALVNVGETKLVVALTEKGIVAVQAADGKEVWQAAFAPVGMTYNSVSPVVDGPVMIYTGSGRGTKAVKFEKDGDKIVAKDLWTNADTSAAFCTPVLHDGLLFGLSAGKGRGSGGGKFYCLNAKTGQAAWTDSATRGTDYGAMVDAGSVIIALTATGQLTAIEPSDKAYKELASIKVSEKSTYAYPVVSGNRIFVRDEESMAMYVVE